MQEPALSFGVAVVLSLLFSFLAQKIAPVFNFLDGPGSRKIHSQPTPLLGGVAIFLAFAITTAAFFFNRGYNFWIVIWGLIFVLFGLIDDKGIYIRARYKIWGHLLISLAFVYFADIHFTFFKAEWVNWALTVGFITFMTNSMNMLDGMDGLDSGIAFLAACFFAILAVNSGQREIVLLALALMGATLGFLRYNFNPASIFLGEAGSTFLGFILAVLAIKLNVYGLWDVALSLHIERVQLISFIIPLIVLGIPIFDTYFVFINRFLNKIKFSQPGKDHSHHRIHLMGFSQKATVLTLYAIQVVLGSIALAMVRADVQQFFALLAIVAVFIFGFNEFLSRVKVYSERDEQK